MMSRELAATRRHNRLDWLHVFSRVVNLVKTGFDCKAGLRSQTFSSCISVVDPRLMRGYTQLKVAHSKILA